MESFKFVIRDAAVADVDKCLALDHEYESEYVWQMAVRAQGDGYQVTFRKERLPRANKVLHETNPLRLQLATVRENCFLVAVGKNEPIVLGYLTMRADPIHKIAMIQDMIVDSDLRGAGIGSRLLQVARQWASENGAKQLMIEVPTTNYPAIQFLQNRGFRFCGFNDQYFRNHDIAVFFGQAIH